MPNFPQVGLEAVLLTTSFEKGANVIDKALNEVTGTMDDAEDASGGLAGGFDALGAVAEGVATGGLSLLVTGVAAASAAIVGLSTVGLKWATEFSGAMKTVQAQTGATDEEMAAFQDTAEAVFTTGLGENFEDVAQAMSVVQRNTGTAGQELEELTKDALILSEVFDKDIQESVRAVDIAVNAFGTTGPAVFDLMTTTLQQTGDPADDLLDTVNEYGGLFAAAGFTAEEMFGVLNSGLEAGAFNFDKIGDSVKEFGVRLFEMTDEQGESLNHLGINAEDLWDGLKDGSTTSAEAMGQILGKLREIEDPVAQNAIGIQFFGTQWEDLGADVILALDPAIAKIGDVAGATAAAGENVTGGLGGAFEELKRTLQVGVVGGFQPILTMIVEKVTPAFQLFADWLAGPGKKIMEDFGAIVSEELGAVLENLGPFIENEVIPALESFGDWLQKEGIPALKKFIKWVKDKLIPELKKMAKFVNEKVLPAIKDFSKFVEETVIPSIKNFKKWVQKLTDDVKKMVDDVTGFIEKLKSTWEKIWITIQKVAEAVWDKIREVIFSTLEKIASFIDKTLTDIARFISDAWEKIKQTTSDLWAKITGAISDAWDKITDVVTDAVDKVKKAVSDAWDSIKTATTDAWNRIKEAVSTAWDNIKQSITDALDRVKTIVSAAWDVIQNNISEKLSAIGQIITEKWEQFKNSIAEKIEAIRQNVAEKFQQIFDTVKEKLLSLADIPEQIGETLIKIGVNIIEKILRGIMDVATFVSDIIAQVKTWFEQVASSISTSFAAGLKLGKNLIDKVVVGIKAFISGGLNFAQTVAKWLKDAFQDILDGASAMWSKIKQIGKDIVANLKAGIQSAWDDFKDWFSGLFDGLKPPWASTTTMATAGDKSNPGFAIGQSIVAGMAQGVFSGAAWVANAMAFTVANAMATARQAAGANSPSALFAALGQDLMTGLQMGIQSELPGVTMALQASVTAPALPVMVGGSTANNTVNQNFANNFGNNTIVAPMDQAIFDAQVARSLQRQMSGAGGGLF